MKNFQLKIYNFKAKKSLNIAWASFRNDMLDTLENVDNNGSTKSVTMTAAFITQLVYETLFQRDMA